LKQIVGATTIFQLDWKQVAVVTRAARGAAIYSNVCVTLMLSLPGDTWTLKTARPAQRPGELADPMLAEQNPRTRLGPD